MKILIIEDEPEMVKSMREFFLLENFLVEEAMTYETGLSKVMNYDYDCVLLDIMLPGGSGLDILRALQQASRKQPVLILSAKGAVEDKVLGLEIGADDYLPKPFHLAELLARIKSIIRRNVQNGDKTLRYKNIELSPDTRQVRVRGEELSLNRKEYDVLYYFMVRPNRLIEKTHLAEAVWGDYIDQSDNLDFIYSQIKNLKRKLRTLHADVDIQAVYGIGYKMT